MQSTAAEPPQSIADDLTTTDGATPEGSVANGAAAVADFDPLRTPMVGMVGLRAFDEAPAMPTLGRGVALNFLQEDELAAGTEAVATFEVVEPESNAVVSQARPGRLPLLCVKTLLTPVVAPVRRRRDPLHLRLGR